MQIDMHYYGTYAMARAAGVKADTAKVIATAAQFVDDNAAKDSIEFRDGARLYSEATAHHALNIRNIDPEDQRRIWVPFHFLPGNSGETYTERLICRRDSRIANEMLQYVLSLSDRPYGMLLTGIAAHVYADTFSHYGFSGISSRRNKIRNIRFDMDLDEKMRDYLSNREKAFRENFPSEEGRVCNIKSWFGETFSGALGHGAAATYPDRPFLKWSFDYEDPAYNSGIRDNPATSLQGCRGLHEFFTAFVHERPDCRDNAAVRFADIKGEVETIVTLAGPKSQRIAAWRDAAKDGRLFHGDGETIPVYNENRWHNQRENLQREEDSGKVNKKTIYYFYQAAAVYRTYVLRMLLPSKGLIVT